MSYQELNVRGMQNKEVVRCTKPHKTAVQRKCIDDWYDERGRTLLHFLYFTYTLTKRKYDIVRLVKYLFYESVMHYLIKFKSLHSEHV